MDEFRSLLDSLESSIKQPSPQHNRLPESVWEEVKVKNHSPDVCRAAWTKICHVTKTHMSLQQMVDVARDLMEKNKNVIKILIGNKDPNFPNAPSVHRANSYNLYTKRRLEETPRPTFKEIAEGWKTLSEGEKQAFALEAEKLNQEAERNLERFLKTLPPEKKQQFLSAKSVKSAKKAISEFDDAPKIHQANGYNIFTKANRDEDPKISFKEIAEKWKQLSEGERKTYTEEAKKVNEQSRLEFETYRQNLTPEKQARFNKEFEKNIKRVSESQRPKIPKPKPPPKLKERELKKAEIQYMKEEKAEAVRENPDTDEDDIMLRLSEAFRSLPYKEQAEYLRKYEAEANEQKKITEFYKSKHIDSPNPPKEKKPHSSGKALKSDDLSVKKIVREESDSSSSSDDSSEEEEVTAKKLSQTSPKKSTPAKKSILMSPSVKMNRRKSESSSSESDSESSDDDKDKKKREMSPVLPVIKQSPRQPSSPANRQPSSPRKRKPSTSSSSSSSSSSSEEDEGSKTVVKGKSPQKPSTPRKRKPFSSSSEEDKGNETVVKVNSPQKPSTPRKRKHSSSSSSSSSSEEEEGNKTVVKKSPKKIVSPRKKMFSSVSEDETDDTSENDKKDKQGSLKSPFPQKMKTTSSLKALKKKKSKSNSGKGIPQTL
ncbi:nucleolar and coiled-body phosphoprotein 1-like [Saccostrea cucullata]|uniref:nucleolar and coiled-body phosphoprotein 1-like n=1 Tax=Saccostrea cuccullata TaxID=36930 RepID=UPI002ED0976D